MSGDRPGSPRRDDRQSFGPQEPWAGAPHEDDVRVAGSPAAQGAPAGDTLGFQAVGVGPADPSGPSGPSDPAGPQGPKGPSGRSRRSPGGGGRRNGVRVVAVVAGAAVVVGGGAVAAFALTGGDDGGKGTVASAPVADAPAAPKVDPKVMEERRRKQALDRASRAVREEDGKGPSLQPKGEPIPTKTPEKDKGDDDGGSGGGGGPTGDPVPAGQAQAIARGMMGDYGSAFKKPGQFGCLVNLWNKESHWNTHAANPSSGAYGIPQALPGSKMASAGSDWRNNAATQIKWGLGYIKGRYGSPCGAWSHSQSVGWY